MHVDDGEFHDHGKYWSNLRDVKETATLVAQSKKYDHILFYGHGGLNSTDASASRIAAMRDTFKANRIYPFHVMYDTGLLEEIKDVVFGKEERANERAGGFTDWTDRIIERVTRRPGRALWREMKSGARLAFAKRTSPGTAVVRTFLNAMTQSGAKKKRVHLVGHSTGGILHAHLIEALAKLGDSGRIASLQLLAPANAVEQLHSTFLPRLKRGRFGIDELHIYNLVDALEKDDQVGTVYRKSLLYLVSRAFEEVASPPTPLLGMHLYSRKLEGLRPDHLFFHYSNGVTSTRDKTNSTSHGGFDNDPATMNSVLRVILGSAPRVLFTPQSLDY